MLASVYFPAADRLLRRGIVRERVTTHHEAIIPRRIAESALLPEAIFSWN
jgi:hypothetical protein